MKRELTLLLVGLALAACAPQDRRADAARGAADPLPPAGEQAEAHQAADPHAAHAVPQEEDPHAAGHAAHAAHAPAAPRERAAHVEHAQHAAPARTGGAPAHAHEAAAPHAAHPPPAAAPALSGALGELVAALLEDPAVRERIQQESELRELWNDPAVRSQVTGTPVEPAMEEGMRKVLAIARGLLADPRVRARIQSDPTLRELWDDPAVRQRILGTHQH